jgi:hypothetical protein
MPPKAESSTAYRDKSAEEEDDDDFDDLDGESLFIPEGPSSFQMSSLRLINQIQKPPLQHRLKTVYPQD